MRGGPFHIGRNLNQIDSLATEIQGNEIKIEGLCAIKLPRTRSVAVNLKVMGQNSGTLTTISLADNGLAFYNGTSKLTLPPRRVQDYESQDALKGSYASSYKGALGVAHVVASAIKEVYVAQMKIAEITDLDNS